MINYEELNYEQLSGAACVVCGKRGEEEGERALEAVDTIAATYTLFACVGECWREARNPLKITTRRFGDGPRNADFPGSRGTVIEAETRHRNDSHLSSWMPAVYLSDNGEVEFGDGGLVLAGEFRAWATAILSVIETEERRPGRQKWIGEDQGEDDAK